MAPAEKHPHIAMPSEADLAALIERVRPVLRDPYLAAHRLVIEALPDIRSAVDTTDGGIGYGARQFGYDGWGMAALAPHKGWVSLVFFRGTSLEDPQGLLEGTGAAVRHVKLRSLDELAARREPLRDLLRAAARLNGAQAAG